MFEEHDSALSAQALTHLKAVGKADLIVGMPSYNNALTASYVISQVVKGLDTYFPDYRSVVFVSDGNSIDGTLSTVKTVNLPAKVNLIPAIYVGISGKGSALKAIFEAAKYLSVKAVTLVDSDLRSITPEWVKLLTSPVLSGTGLVVPLYSRRKYDGTITNFLCYPVTTALYGKNIRQPIGGDFGLSIDFVKKLLQSPLWGMREVRMFGIDIFETHTALAEGFKVDQAFLGIKEHEAKDPFKHLASMFREVVGTMFACAEKYETVWRGIAGVSQVDIIGEEKNLNSQQPIPIDLQRMIASFIEDFDKYRPVFRSVLNDDTFLKIEKLKYLEKTAVSFPPDTWAKIVYTFMAKFHKTVVTSERGFLIDALRVLWLGRLATFIKETAESTPEETEKIIREQAETFVRLKPYLNAVY